MRNTDRRANGFSLRGGRIIVLFAAVHESAHLRHADCVGQCPSLGQSGKHMLVLSSSLFGTFETCRQPLKLSASGV
jgi:hypothetical protein